MPIILSGPLAGEELLELDPDGAILQIGPGTSYNIVEQSFPSAPLSVLYSSSIDVEGEIPVSRRRGNREISITVEFVDAGGGLLADLQAKFAKLQDEGGEARRTGKNGDVRTYDICAADGFSPVYDLAYYLGDVTRVSMTLACKPIARGEEIDLGDNVDTATGALIFSEASVEGDVKADSRLVLDNDGSANWSEVVWGIEDDREYAHTDSTGTGALRYEAETRALLSGSTLTAVGTATGTGSNVVVSQQLPTAAWLAVMSTQASGGSHLSHVGLFRVMARIRSTGLAGNHDVHAALQWGQGDLRTYTQNSPVTIPAAQTANWQLADLGLVTLPKPVTGTMRWEGRIVAKASTGVHTIQIDHVELFPADHGFGQARAVTLNTLPSTFSALDNFNQTAGALAGKTLEVGGTWAGAGSATDFTVDASAHTATRSINTDPAYTSGRFAIAGTATFTDATVVVQLPPSSTVKSTQGVFARYTDASNNLLCVYRANLNRIQLSTEIGGAVDVLLQQDIDPLDPVGGKQLALTLGGDGSWRVTLNGVLFADGQSDVLATGGALATGKVGFYDAEEGPAALTRVYDSFWAAAGAPDAAVYAGRSLEIRSDGVQRQDSAAAGWQRVAYTGDYLRVPPSGAEGHAVRVIVQPVRSPFTSDGVARHDLPNSISARLYVEPRYLI